MNITKSLKTSWPVAVLTFSVIFLTAACEPIQRQPATANILKPRFGVQNISNISHKHALIVTHATTEFDENKTAAIDIDKIIEKFKAQGRPVIYLISKQDREGYQEWYTKERAPDFALFSEGGEHNLPIAGNEVTIVGGFFGSTDTLNGCHALTVKDAIRMHFELSSVPLTVNIPIKATYFYSEWEELKKSLLKTHHFDKSQYRNMNLPFASIYFLREGNNGAGDDGHEQFFAHKYFGDQNKSYRAGLEVSRQDYQFHFYINDQLFESVEGTGQRIVHIKLITK